MIGQIAVIGLAAAVQIAAAQDTSVVERLLDRIAANEKAFVARLRDFRPVVETYIQEQGESADGPPARDHYMLGKLDLRGDISHGTMVMRSDAPKGLLRSIPFLGRGGSIAFRPEGFAEMVLIDSHAFSRQTYDFEFVQREFLGDVRCLVFDVTPKDRKARGKFVGRVWVEDRDYHIVRFNGTYSNSTASRMYFHFDSWRVNVEPGLWAPAFVYVEESGIPAGKGRRLQFKAQTRLWGYNAGRNTKLSELTSILVEADKPVSDQSGAKDVSPVESQRSWERQAEENFIQRLEKSGLLAEEGDVEGVLNTVVNNLLVTSRLNLDVECRVLLTTPFETISIGQTIIVSRGLIDVLPDEASLAMVLAGELAHIALGHRTETAFAFGDRVMFDDQELMRRLRIARPPAELEAAARKSMEILTASPYKAKLANAGLFLRALVSRAPALKNLIQANLGNQLASDTTVNRVAELISQAPPLEEEKLEQIAALPLGSRIKLDPWTNRTTMLKARPVALLSAREKMPFEVSPFMIHLTRAGDPPAGGAAAQARAAGVEAP